MSLDSSGTPANDGLGNGADGMRLRVLRTTSIGVAVLLAASVLSTTATAAPQPQAAQVNLDQCANGAGPPEDPCQWQNGNLHDTNSHYAEGDSIAYRAVVSRLEPGTRVYSMTIGWDVRNGGMNAIDYLTSYDRIDEEVLPCEGISPCVYGGALAVPAPAGSPQPQTSFAALPAAEKFISIFGGTLIDAVYLTQGSLSATQSESTMKIRFTASAETAVIAWGGHVADRDDWGSGVSAGNISGSPYHMRLKDIDGKPGNQDRSMKLSLAEHPVFPLGASLTIVKEVINDQGGSAAAADFLIHLLDEDDQDAAPAQPGDGFGVSYVDLPAGTYHFAEDGPAGYAMSFDPQTQDCAADGSITLADGDIKTCVMRNDDQVTRLNVTKEFKDDAGASGSLEDVQLFIDAGTEAEQQVQSGVPAIVSPGNHTVSELGPDGYVGTISGDCRADGSVSVALGSTAECLITNDDIEPLLNVTKVVINDDGGTATAAAWQYFIDDEEVAEGDHVALSVGGHDVREEGMDGYAQSFSGDCDASGHVELALGDDKECIIINDDIAPKLTVTKVVVNDAGGSLRAEDVPLFIDGEPALNHTAYEVLPGLHTVSETSPDGYAASFSEACAVDGQIMLALGEEKECVITNDDIAPTLRVLKVFVNEFGGTLTLPEDAVLYIDGSQVANGEARTLMAGPHNVSEDPIYGYSGSIGGDCDAAGDIVLAVGDQATCIITNHDIQPLLTVTKQVVNLDGGTAEVADFALFVGDTGVLSGVETGFNASTYVVSEVGDAMPGYAATFSGDCDELSHAVTLHVGDVKACLIVNDDIAPRLNLTKVVINDSGGSATAGDWRYFVGDSEVPLGDKVAFHVGGYDIREEGPAGYAVSFAGDCDASGHVDLALADDKECILINDDIAPKLTVTKVVVNDAGGSLRAEDVPLFIGNGSVTSGVQVTLMAGVPYNVSETQQPGYAASFSEGCPDGAVTLALAEERECIITNDDIAPKLTVTKVVVNDDGGHVAAEDVPLFVDGESVTSGVQFASTAGEHTVGESSPSGYAASFSESCSAGAISLALAEEAECVITNDDIAPRLRVVKVVILNDGGLGVPGDFSLHLEADDASLQDFAGEGAPGTFLTFDAGNYSVTEAWRPDFLTSYSAGCSGSLGLDQEALCTVTNDDLSLASRTQGFWSTHTKFTQDVFRQKLGGSFSVGATGHLRTIDTDGKLFGAYYADISKMTTGAARTPVDQARMQLLQQLVTAKLNCAAFGCSIADWMDIQDADAAFAAGDKAAILAAAAEMDAFNNANDSDPLPSSVGKLGGASPKTSQQLANKAFWNSP